MTVAVFVTSESDAACLIPWGVHFAHADHTELLIVCPRKSKGKRGWDVLDASEKDDNALFRAVFDILDLQDPTRVVLKEAIAEGNESTNLDRVAIETRELIATSPEEAFVEEIEALDVRLLLLPARELIKGASEEEMRWHQKLFTMAPCQVAFVKGRPPDRDVPIQVLVASQGNTDADASLALVRGCQLAKSSAGQISLLYVRPDDDVVARDIARKHLGHLMKSVSERNIEVNQIAVLTESFLDGIQRAGLENFNLVLVGTRQLKTIRSLFRDLGKTVTDGHQFSVVTIRSSIPLADRVWSRLKKSIRSKVPQLDRDQRVKLVDGLQNSSRFDFDFVALISLSTLIAALGLARDSGAVVIGAMLVAPLMTPLVGMGFALVQGNVKLIRSALQSVMMGFTVALAIGVMLGLMFHWFAPSFEISNQMKDRGSPNLLDLVVALASGVAAAYAMGRPNLVSALPGVAIAAALVPPIATSGLALAMGDPVLAGGACLLFFTNIVAIVLGTAITFWSVGISTRISHDRAVQIWPRYWFLGFVIISFVLAAGMSYFNPLVHAPNQPNNGSNVKAFTDFD